MKSEGGEVVGEIEETIIRSDEIVGDDDEIVAENDEIIRAVRFVFLRFKEIGDETIESVRNLFVSVTEEEKLKLCVENPKCLAGCATSPFKIGDVVVFLPLCKHIIHLRCYVKVCSIPRVENHLCPTHRVGLHFRFMFEYVDNASLLEYESEITDDDEFVQPPSPQEELMGWVPCPVCDEDFLSYEPTRMILHCGDYFHEGCLDEEFLDAEQKLCPSCGEPYLAADVVRSVRPVNPNADDYVQPVVPILDWDSWGMIRDIFDGVDGLVEEADEAPRGGPPEWAGDDGDDFP
ncbi:hypothetical protein ABFX02_08G176500 [Erythranthe guttata]